MAKTMSLRLDDERAATLELVARAENGSITDAVRAAIDTYVEQRRQDPEFMHRLTELRERESVLFDRLAQ